MTRRIWTVMMLSLCGIFAFASPIKGIIGCKEILSTDGGKDKLPYDSIVEYIQTRGQQWIDTGYVPKSLPVFRLEGNIPYSMSFVIGMSSRNGAFGFRVKNGNSSYGQLFLCQDSMSWGNAVAASSRLYANTITVTSDGEKINCNNLLTPSITFDFSQNTSSLCLCNSFLSVAYHYSDSGCRIRLFQIWDGESLVMDLVPVRFTTPSGETDGGMYDRVSGRLFRNSGTGTFIVGPDKQED